MIVPLGKLISAAKSDAILGLGTSDRAKVIDYIDRAIELAAFKANWNPWIATMDVCSDHCGVVTLPSIVGTVLSVNVGGRPTTFRNRWYEFHINGFGSCCGGSCGYTTEMDPSPVFQDLREYCVVAAICEEPEDGNGNIILRVEGETIDANSNPKDAITVIDDVPTLHGVKVQLLTDVAATDPALTYFRRITRVTKPVTKGYVKLIAFPMRQFALAVNLGYYAPHETNPLYQRIKVGATCKWVRIKFRRSSIALVNDWDVVPISSYQAAIDLLKSIRLSDSNNIDASEAYLAKAVRLLQEVQGIESGSTYTPLQVQPGFGISTIDYR